MSKIVAVNKQKFLDFDKITRLDEFLAFYLDSNKSFNDFWFVCKFIFTLCHGQSSVERGFNVNKQTIAENLEDLGLTSLRMIYDEIMHLGGSIKDFPIPPSLLLACQSAHMKYKADLERKKKELNKREVGEKRKLLMEELNVLKKQKTDDEALVKSLQTDSDKLILEAGKTSDTDKMRVWVMEVNSFKKTVMELEEKITKYDTSIKHIQNEIERLK